MAIHKKTIVSTIRQLGHYVIAVEASTHTYISDKGSYIK